MEKVKNPELRFKKKGGEEYEDWEEKSIQEAHKTITPKGKLKLEEYFSKGEYPIIDQSKDLVNGYSKNDKYLNSVKTGVVIFGDHTTIVKYVDFDFIAGADGIKILQPYSNLNAKFFYYTVCNLNIASSGYNRHFSILKNKLIYLPSLEEQEKIAGCLSSLDKVIEKGEEETKNLKEYKKGLMQKLFSRELRFKKETGEEYADWEEKKLGEVGELKKGFGLAKDKICQNGNYPCILYGQLFTTYKEVIHNVKSYTNEAEGRLSLYGDVLLPASTTTQAIDLAKASALLVDNVLLGGDINIIRNTNNLYHPVFLSYQLNNHCKKEIESLGQGITIIHLYAKQLEGLKIKLPSMEEQEKIAGCLSSLDKVIEKGEEETKNLKEYKKGLMQKLFPKHS